jgi:hypothetical protein
MIMIHMAEALSHDRVSIIFLSFWQLLTLDLKVSRTVEYAYNDFCIAEMAKGLGQLADAEKYLERSDNWKNMYKADQTS